MLKITRFSFIVSLAFILIFTQILQPITTLGLPTEVAESNNEKLFKTIEEIELHEGITIYEDTYLYGEPQEDKAIIQYAEKYIEIPLHSVVEVEKNEVENIPQYHEVDGNLTITTLPKDTVLYSLEPDDEERIVIKDEIDYLIDENEIGIEVVYFGNVEYYLSKEDRDAAIEGITKKNDREEDEGKEIEKKETSQRNETKSTEVNNKEKVESEIEQETFKENIQIGIQSTQKGSNNSQPDSPSPNDKEQVDNNKNVKTSPPSVWGKSVKYFKVIQDNLEVYDNRTGKLVKVGELKRDQVYPRLGDYGANWHIIQYGNIRGYVFKSGTEKVIKANISNENKGFKNQSRTFKALKNVTVYDNTSGNLIPFGVIEKGVSYPIVSDYGNWWRVIYADRVGYVKKSEVEVQFTSSDKYFKTNINLPVYDNRSGKLVKVGELPKGEVYPRVSDYGNWHRIQFGNIYGYVRKADTSVATGKEIKNINTNYKNQSRTFKGLKNVTVYDNTSGNLIPFGVIEKGVSYPIVSDYGNWWRVIYADRVGYVKKSGVEVQFTSSDKYFKTNINLPVYDNRSGKLVKVGELPKGEVYPRVRDYGNWHQIKFGNIYGYVHKSGTSPASAKEIKNLNNNFKPMVRTLTTLSEVTVYDNSSGKLVPFGKIEKGVKFPLTSDYGDKWWRIIYADRVGYIRKDQVRVAISSNDKYFRAMTNTEVYDNSTGKLIKVGELVQGQAYPIVSSYGNWWRVRYGNEYGYVRKSHTGYATAREIKNINKSYKNTNRQFRAKQKATVYDNTSGKLVPFGQIEKDQFYPIASNYGNWWRIIYAGRVGYVHKTEVQYERIYKQYNITLNDAVNKQMNSGTKPQTDVYNGEIYVYWKHFSSVNASNRRGTIVENALARTGPSSNHHILYKATNSRNVKLIEDVKDKNNARWWKITRDSLPYWINATQSQVSYYMNPNNFKDDPVQVYQFLDLSYYTGVPAKELETILNGKGILSGKAQNFVNAAKKWGINEVYLASHALLETGNGTSELAKGVKYNGTTVYNMFGIGAYDKCPVECGAKRAYELGWTSPEKAIEGGAKFVKQDYIAKGQNTLYKMRWNPDALVKGNPSHQYATDVGWATKQLTNFPKIYSKGNYNLMYEIPVYK